MRRNIYFQKEFDLVFVKICKKRGMDYSRFVRACVLHYIQHVKPDEQFKEAAKAMEIKDKKAIVDICIRQKLQEALFRKNMDYVIYLAIHNTKDKGLIECMIKDALKIAKIYKNNEMVGHYKYMASSVKDAAKYKMIKDQADHIVFENAKKLKFARVQNKASD